MCVSEAKEKRNEVFTVLLQYLDNPDSDPTVRLRVCTCSMYVQYVKLIPSFQPQEH